MEIKPITPEQVEKSKQDHEIIRLTAHQVIKDFSQFGMQVEIPENMAMAYDNLFNQLESHIHTLATTNIQRLYALLYRIDINDSMIRSRQKQHDEQPLPKIITALILERELKKVLFRIYFQSNKK